MIEILLPFCVGVICGSACFVVGVSVTMFWIANILDRHSLTIKDGYIVRKNDQ